MCLAYEISASRNCMIAWNRARVATEFGFKVAPYSFRSVSLKFCPRTRLVVLYATRVVDVACVVVFLKLRFQRIYLLRQNIVIYTRGPSWDCRLVARGNWNPDFCDVT
jgi:hypothetical protein